MKQLLMLAAICLLLALASSANPVSHDKKPTRHKVTDDGKKSLQVLANYKTGNATVNFNSGKAGKATIVVLNENGNTVIKQGIKLQEGKNKIDISHFTDLEEGYYTICLNTNYASYSAPFLLWK